LIATTTSSSPASAQAQGQTPPWLVGVGLTFVYGWLLGELRRRAGGLLVPFITHLLTDLVIIMIVLVLVRT
jgi:membrane protease YdiL (CAAX protease family)